jgi:hypothetical protein
VLQEGAGMNDQWGVAAIVVVALLDGLLLGFVLGMAFERIMSRFWWWR